MANALLAFIIGRGSQAYIAFYSASVFLKTVAGVAVGVTKLALNS